MSIFVRQLDGSLHAGENCGPASVAMALRWCTEHDVMPSPTEVRRHMKVDAGGTNQIEQKRGFDAYLDDAARRGWPLEPANLRPGMPYQSLLRQWRLGFGAILAVDYSVLPRRLKGDPDFDGLHAVFAAGSRKTDGETYIKVWDPLNDGRRTSIPGPGPIWWPSKVMAEACAGYSGEGKASANLVAKPDVAMDVRKRCSERIQRLEESLSAAHAVLSGMSDAAEAAAAEIADLLPGLQDLGDGAVSGQK